MKELKSHIKKLREDFSAGTLSEKDLAKNPFDQFSKWLQQGVESEIDEIQAMTLSTVSVKGKPSSRIVYLREFENNKFTFYTNYQSKKALELQQTPYASIVFFWKELERQIRIEGEIVQASPKQSDAYFNARPYESKLGAWASQQSSELSSRADLEKKVEEIKTKFSPETIRRPEFWGGFTLKANYYEFWQGRKNRLHDRIVYELFDSNWKIKRLAP